MKELDRFRQFLNEDQMKNLAKLLRDEADQPDNKVGKDIMLKYAAQAEKTDVKDIKSLLGKLEDELIAKHPDTFSGEDDIVGSFLSTSKNYTVQENELHEGTWSLGTVAEMVKIMGKLSQIRKMGAAKGNIELENLDRALYNVFGDDGFHDAIDNAKSTDDDDRFNNFIGDAEARAKELYKDELRYVKSQGETGFEQALRFGLEENDKVLDELLNERAPYRNPEIPVDKVLQVLQDFYVRDLTRLKQELERSSGEPTAQPGFKAKLEDMMAKLASFGGSSLEDVEAKVKLKEEKEEMNEAPAVFAEIDQMIGAIKDQMDPDDAFDSLVSEFEAISGGTRLLHQALKNISLDNNLGEIRSAYNEEKKDE